MAVIEPVYNLVFPGAFLLTLRDFPTIVHSPLHNFAMVAWWRINVEQPITEDSIYIFTALGHGHIEICVHAGPSVREVDRKHLTIGVKGENENLFEQGRWKASFVLCLVGSAV